jgi:hypothetical protein
MRRVLRNLWMTLRATSSLWTRRSREQAGGPLPELASDMRFARRVVGNVRPAAPRPDRYAHAGGKRTPSRPQTRPLCARWWETYGGRTPNRPEPRKLGDCNLILSIATGWHVAGIKRRPRLPDFLLADGPFHCVRMGVERTAR